MVSQRTSRGSRTRIFQAAAREFAARGFDGATVDRIAARARLNKAMLYYHFASKAALYRDVLADMFSAAAAAVAAVREAGGPPDHQLRAFILAIAREGQARPHFPPIWLREIAEGGRHLDDRVVTPMRGVLGTLAAILDDGRRADLFGDVPTFVVQVGIVAPLLFFLASGPVRERFKRKGPAGIAAIPTDAMIHYVQTMTLGAIRSTSTTKTTKRTKVRSRRS
jgi:TetR/AcrR family transcriptional regulator